MEKATGMQYCIYFISLAMYVFIYIILSTFVFYFVMIVILSFLKVKHDPRIATSDKFHSD